ncbi:cytochrome b-c1 complex subunit 10 [Amblyraja radiata]|uniref:cytochrome b-c1 complex subunit 10 n=1 Tax=Amblyraja radiata TaxID=386614 RepID=UPI0014037E22|nr:cytochrome b-c1 complex subunit 10 [Amblyraja radiata]XP_032902764.1 cytochrome b-c1 complex subunit 10 [Amblyraja radiata]XP_055514574.1 cytochrome b-c1 complex subunit 10 [Leucoraja erinacea]
MLERVLGPRYAQLLRNWIPTMTTWGAVGSVAFIYVTDWKVIVGRIPYIKGKFKTE